MILPTRIGQIRQVFQSDSSSKRLSRTSAQIRARLSISRGVPRVPGLVQKTSKDQRPKQDRFC
eukprot:scaffold245_cov256-Pinguiococcus_pyrenoidosus.AAC.11